VIVALNRRRRVQVREERWAALVAGLDPGGEGSLTSELVRRRAGELAWRELSAELAVRARTITWLGWTGGWGRPPREISLDPALPPARALDALLDDIADGNVEVSEEDRAAAARIAAAYTSATYAAPLPQDAVDAIDADRTRDTTPPPGPGASSAGSELASGTDAAAPGASPAPDASTAAATSDASRTPQPALRADTDRLIALIRAAR